MKYIWTLLLFCVTALPVHAKRMHPERFYQDNWCTQQKGISELVLPDRTRCDCLTKRYAVEFDFGDKWAESVGQALYYSVQTGKKPGIVLILEKPTDYKYWIRLNTVIEQKRLRIHTWKIEAW